MARHGALPDARHGEPDVELDGKAPSTGSTLVVTAWNTAGELARSSRGGGGSAPLACTFVRTSTSTVSRAVKRSGAKAARVIAGLLLDQVLAMEAPVYLSLATLCARLGGLAAAKALPPRVRSDSDCIASRECSGRSDTGLRSGW